MGHVSLQLPGPSSQERRSSFPASTPLPCTGCSSAPPPPTAPVPQMQWRPTGPGRALRWRTCRARGGPKRTDPLLTSPLEGLPPLSPPRRRAQRGRLTSPASHSKSQMARSGVQVGKTPTTTCREPPDQPTPHRPHHGAAPAVNTFPGRPSPCLSQGPGPQQPPPPFLPRLLPVLRSLAKIQGQRGPMVPPLRRSGGYSHQPPRFRRTAPSAPRTPSPTQHTDPLDHKRQIY